MQRRSAAIDQTRQRIVAATMAAHAELGILETSFQDVAARADVATGTVYRHFPTRDELVSACGQKLFEDLKLPDPTALEHLFGRARSRRARIELLVSEVIGIYCRGGALLRRGREARHALPLVAEGQRALEGVVDALIAEALRPLQVPEVSVATVRALLDARFWETLLERVGGEQRSRDALLELVACAVRPSSSPTR